MKTRTLLLALVIPISAASLPSWTAPDSVVALERENKDALDHASALREQLVAVQGPRTVENTLSVYDEIVRYLNVAGGPAGLLRDTHPDAAFQQAAAKAAQTAEAFRAQISLDPRIYQAISALNDVKGLNGETSFALSRVLKTFRDAGVDRPEDVRRQIAAKRGEIVKLQQQFDRNIVEGLAWIAVAPEELDGVPQDFVRGHKRDEKGNVLISNDRADIEPVTFYCKNADTRRRVFQFSQNRGYPANMAVLSQLISTRHKLAELVGFPSYAEMNLQDRMVGGVAKQREFLIQVDQASGAASKTQIAMLLEAKRRDVAGASEVEPWDVQYYIRAIRDHQYGFNEQEARAYYPYNRIRDSVLQVASEMFGISFRSVKAPVWHPSVQVYDVLERGTVIGRIYLDMFPRAGKYQHFRTSYIHIGVEGRQLPEGALICNMPAPSGDDPGLMTPELAVTFFHEFGHLLHGIFSGHGQWAVLNRPENDFIEAPSQLLEEWYRNPNVLARFAKHYKTGEPIPASLVEHMQRAENFGEAILTRRQLWLAAIALEYEAGDGRVDTDKISEQAYAKYGVTPFPKDTHLQCNFTHLANPGYAGAYYTYQWSLVIAKDLFTKFDQNNLLDPKVALKYRDAVLSRGGTEPAAQLVENFLGRPFNLKAYQGWLQAN